MKINGLIDTEYGTVFETVELDLLSEELKKKDYVAVSNENLAMSALLTHKDIYLSEGVWRADDIFKPHVSPDEDIKDVMSLMKESGTYHLPVFSNNEFQGVISLMSIAERLLGTLLEVKQNYQKVIHDVRNPIGNLKGLLSLLEESEAHADNLDTIALCDQSCNHALSILEDLLYIESDETRPLEKEPTDMNEFYRQCINEQSGLGVNKSITINNNVGNVVIIKDVDRKQIKRAVHNIISNAIKFSFHNSIIKVSSKVEGGKLILKIADSGVGIPPHLHNDLFRRFSSAQRTGTNGEASTGLGLCFTKQCIERHGGEITFKSIEGIGTKFYLTL